MEPISAGIMAGGSLVKGIFDYFGARKQAGAQEDMNEKQWAAYENELRMKNVQFEKNFNYTKAIDKQNLAMKKDQLRYNRINDYTGKFIGLMNSNRALRKSVTDRYKN